MKKLIYELPNEFAVKKTDENRSLLIDLGFKEQKGHDYTFDYYYVSNENNYDVDLRPYHFWEACVTCKYNLIETEFLKQLNSKIQTGLTKREYFAGLAMQSILSRNEICSIDLHNSIYQREVSHADELLKQLER